jgi:hypothetical protein
LNDAASKSQASVQGDVVRPERFRRQAHLVNALAVEGAAFVTMATSAVLSETGDKPDQIL